MVGTVATLGRHYLFGIIKLSSGGLGMASEGS